MEESENVTLLLVLYAAVEPSIDLDSLAVRSIRRLGWLSKQAMHANSGAHAPAELSFPELSLSLLFT